MGVGGERGPSPWPSLPWGRGDKRIACLEVDGAEGGASPAATVGVRDLALELLDFEALEDVVYFEVVEALEGNAAFEAGLNVSHVFLEAP